MGVLDTLHGIVPTSLSFVVDCVPRRVMICGHVPKSRYASIVACQDIWYVTVCNLEAYRNAVFALYASVVIIIAFDVENDHGMSPWRMPYVCKRENGDSL